jgi:hypothetical protein
MMRFSDATVVDVRLMIETRFQFKDVRKSFFRIRVRQRNFPNRQVVLIYICL